MIAVFSMTGDDGMDYAEIRREAKRKMKGCRVCRECNGLGCIGEIPGFGGLRTARSFIRNIEALREYGLIMNSLSHIEEPDTAMPLFGRTLSMPVMVAPVGAVTLNCKINGDAAEEELRYDLAVAKGATTAGTLAFCGDGGAPYMYEGTLAACKACPGMVVPTIKPREDARIIEKAKLAEAVGAPAVAADIDAATLINMRLLGQPVGPKSPESIRKVAESVNIPFIVKGIMSAAEALQCAAAGAKAVVVSNHGGRVLDGMAGTADVLPAIAAAVKGKITVLVDGGIRSGEDVLKMLALGADAVLIGRPVAVAAVGGGAAGVALYLEKIRRELSDAMMITGVADVRHVSADILMKLK